MTLTYYTYWEGELQKTWRDVRASNLATFFGAKWQCQVKAREMSLQYGNAYVVIQNEDGESIGETHYANGHLDPLHTNPFT